MKKIFFFAAAMLASVGISAETVFDWTNNVGKLELSGTAAVETIKSQTNTVDTKSITFANGYSGDPANYAELTLDGAGFLAGDVVIIDYFYNNSGEKVATVGIYNTADEELAASPNGINGRLENGFSTFQYTLTDNMDTIRIARAKTGKTKTCVAKLEVVRGGVVIEKAGTPIFSVAAGEYNDPFKVSLSATPAEKIFVSVNNGIYTEYADSIEINQYNVDYVVSAFATYEGAENSDTVTAEYRLVQFIPRTKFNARKVIKFAGIQASDIQILDPNSATIGEYEMDKQKCATVNYINQKNFDGSQDSTMSISFAGREGVNFVYKNKDSKSNIMICAPNFLVTNGSNFEMHLTDVLPGDTVVFVVTAKGSTSPVFNHTYSTTANFKAYEPDDLEDPDYTDGNIYTKQEARVDDDYCGYSNLVYIVKEGKTTAKLKEGKGGYRLAEILIGAYRGEEPEWQGVESVAGGSVKAVKTFENGQLVIIKNGVKYNVLGSQL
jgi:hypothetical protein